MPSNQWVVVAIAGDSGDGIQSAGQHIAYSCARTAFYVQSFSDFPAEIRAPIGTLAGVSSFNLVFSRSELTHVPKDIDLLVALNPAAYTVLQHRASSRTVILFDSDQWTERAFAKAKLNGDPLKELKNKLMPVPLTMLASGLESQFHLSAAKAKKNRNMIAVGIVLWMQNIDLTYGIEWIVNRYPASITDILIAALQIGYAYAETTEIDSSSSIDRKISFAVPYQLNNSIDVKSTQVTGNEAIILGLIQASARHRRSIFLAGYPITPASDLLQYARKFASTSLQVIQAEDEIAAAGMALGASYAGAIGVSCTSGPGFDLKSEMIGLGIMAELPLVIIDVQRSGPSTGMPTKTEQTDLLAALFGRHGESWVSVFAIPNVKSAISVINDAVDWSVKTMSPVIILSEAALAHTSTVIVYEESLPYTGWNNTAETPFAKRNEMGAPSWIIPGTPDRQSCIGGLERHLETGEVSYDAQNHERMIQLRRSKIENQAQPYDWVCGDDKSVLWITFGSVSGSIDYYRQHVAQNMIGDHLVLTQIWPLPSNFWDILRHYQKCFVVELSDGQLVRYLRSFGRNVSFESHCQITGQALDCERLSKWVEEISK